MRRVNTETLPAQVQTGRTVMKHLIIDFIKRWKWWLGGATAFYLFWCAVMLLEEENKFFFWVVPFVGPYLVARDLQKGTVRAHSLLPVSRKSLAKAYFIQAVILPLTMVIAPMLLMITALTPFKSSAASAFAFIPHVAILCFAFSGTLLFFLTLQVLGPRSGLWNELVATIAVASWGLIFFMAMLLTTDESIHQWSTMAVYKKSLLLAGVVVGIGSFFTSRRLVESRAAFRPGSSPVRERTPARWIVFPSRTAGLLEPWIAGLGISLLVTLLFGSTVTGMFAVDHGWDLKEAVRTIIEGPYLMFCFLAFFVLTSIAGIRFLMVLRLIRTLPLTGWRLTWILASFPMLACVALSLLTVMVLFAAGQQDALSALTVWILILVGFIFIEYGFLVQYGRKFFAASVGVGVPLILILSFLWRGSSSTEISLAPLIGAALICVLLSGVGIWIIHEAITERSETYHPENFIGPGGMGR